ncbi:hypothetical protein J0S82_020777 [Galemys pyrenaicus]|uniref:Uncharacterized protein n=1 Tax=Galemys pyrenaicus TaxID=202257 RepID=A0A8J5ZW17_GALPY|nr:hypothetical protein J0S82_020777 [Galemys pyrenaicus]
MARASSGRGQPGLRAPSSRATASAARPFLEEREWRTALQNFHSTHLDLSPTILASPRDFLCRTSGEPRPRPRSESLSSSVVGGSPGSQANGLGCWAWMLSAHPPLGSFR